MSADNFLGIYKANNRKWVGRGCWSECGMSECKTCENKIVFVAKSVKEAITLAQQEITSGNYEYGYFFINW